MKLILLLALVFEALVYSVNSYSQPQFPVLEEPFATRIISTGGWELEGVFAPGLIERA